MSLLGTLAATAILAGIRAEWPCPANATRPQVAALPSLTSGGKFAARAEDGAAPDGFVTLLALPPILPMFTAPGVPVLGPAPATDGPSLPAVAEAPVAAKPSRPPTVRREARHLASVAARLPRRSGPEVIAMAELPDLSGTGAEDPSMWSRSKLAYRQVAAWGGALVDHLLP